MNYLSLFSGAGGGDLASQHLLGHKCVGYVEYEDYPQRVIAQRIKDGLLDEAPIFGDIRAFISEGYARAYQGMVDVVTGGFPCQPFSAAGKQLGADDPRNMWPSTLQIIKTVNPRYAFMENVAGLTVSGYFGTILGQLSEIGYDAKWTVLGADMVGANHHRKRIWILAYPKMLDGAWSNEKKDRRPVGLSCKPGGHLWWETRPEPCRMDDGLAFGMDRLKAIGNGQVPQVAATAWKILTDRGKR